MTPVCTARTTNGRPCQSPRLPGLPHCAVHAAQHAQEAALQPRQPDRCTATTTNGQPCASKSTTAAGTCLRHHPDRLGQTSAAQLARDAAHRRGRVRNALLDVYLDDLHTLPATDVLALTVDAALAVLLAARADQPIDPVIVRAIRRLATHLLDRPVPDEQHTAHLEALVAAFGALQAVARRSTTTTRRTA